VEEEDREDKELEDRMEGGRTGVGEDGVEHWEVVEALGGGGRVGGGEGVGGGRLGGGEEGGGGPGAE
jgi:hypothetical protein